MRQPPFRYVGALMLIACLSMAGYWVWARFVDPKLQPMILSGVDSSEAVPLAELANQPSTAAGKLPTASGLANTTAPVSGEALMEEDNPYQEAVIKGQLMQVADLYESTSQYPPYSQPIQNQIDLDKPTSDDYSGVSMPFPLPGQATISLELNLSRLQFFHGEDIPVSLRIEGGNASDSITVFATLASFESDMPVSVSLNLTDAHRQFYSGVLGSGSQDATQWPVEMLVKAYVEWNDQQLMITAPLRYSASVATLNHVAFSEIQGANLRIPLEFNVRQSGYYFVSANLYSAQTRKSLIHLEAEGPMEQGAGHLDLLAHYSAMSAVQDAGPYILSDIRIQRGAEDGENHDLAGNSAYPWYEVEGYSLSDYQAETYEDPLTQERLAFLRQLGEL